MSIAVTTSAAHFRKCAISALSQDVDTTDPARTAPNLNFTYIDLSAVDQERKEIFEAKQLLGADAPSRARQIVKTGDVLVSTVRPNLNGVAVVSSEHDGAIASTGFCVIRPCKDRLDTSFLFHWVRSPIFVDAMVQQATGASYPAVSDKIVKQSQIPLPPLPEQRRIAAILDQADALRAKRRAALAQLDEMAQAIFVEMFGDPANNPRKWPIKKFGDLVSNEDGKRRPLKLSDRAEVQGQYPYYGASGVIDQVNDYIFEGPRLLIGEDGANLLARSSPIAFMADGKFWANNHAHVLADNGKANLRFLEQYIMAIDLTPYVTGSAQPKLTQASLNGILVYCPPIAAQEVFSDRLANIERLKGKMVAGKIETDSLFASLQHRAFNGDL